MTRPTPAEAWELCHDLRMPAAQAAKRLGVGTSAYWSLVAEHKLARETLYDEMAPRAMAAPADALKPAQAMEAANSEWRKRRASELLRAGLTGVVVAERLGTSKPGPTFSEDC